MPGSETKSGKPRIWSVSSRRKSGSTLCHSSGGSVGFKVNAFQRLLFDANLLFALDHNGVRDRVTPLVGFEYSF